MEIIAQINGTFIENNTNYPALISELKQSFSTNKTIVPQRHHHDFPNPKVGADSTMLLMPAWYPGKDAGVKVVTVSPENKQFDLPSIQGTYIYLDAENGQLKAILEAKSLTVKRTAATSALASSFLSKENASSLLMIGTGALSADLIMAHASVRPIKTVYVWGRHIENAKSICEALRDADFTLHPIKNIEDKISEVDIIACATLSKTPLVLGKHLQDGQHIDLVGAYKPDMREADDEAIVRASVYLDAFQSGLKESGDIAIPIQNGILKQEQIKADLFQLCSGRREGRRNNNEITLFKSVGHALEDLVAASYYYNQYIN